MRDRDARRLALTLAGFMAGHRNRCDRKPLDEPPAQVMSAVLDEWENSIRRLTAADLNLRKEPGVDYAVTFLGRHFGIYRDASGIPPAPPKIADFYICLGNGDCPTWVYKFYGPYRLPIEAQEEDEQ